MIPLAGQNKVINSFLNNSLIKGALGDVVKGGISQGIASTASDPVNKVAGMLFGLPYLTMPTVAVMGLNAGATASGTLDEARRLGMFK
jgi:hypothetical protein